MDWRSPGSMSGHCRRSDARRCHVTLSEPRVALNDTGVTPNADAIISNAGRTKPDSSCVVLDSSLCRARLLPCRIRLFTVPSPTPPHAALNSSCVALNSPWDDLNSFCARVNGATALSDSHQLHESAVVVTLFLRASWRPYTSFSLLCWGRRTFSGAVCSVSRRSQRFPHSVKRAFGTVRWFLLT